MIVLDTSFLVAFANSRDHHHEAAAAVWPQLSAGAFGPILLSEYVVVETATVLAARAGLALAVAVVDLLLAADDVELVLQGRRISSVHATFAAQPEFELSFVDAALLDLIDNRGATHLATFDRQLARHASAIVVGPVSPA